MSKRIFIDFDSKLVTGSWQLAVRFHLPTSLFRPFWIHKNGLDPLISMESLFLIVSAVKNILYLPD